MRLRQRLEAAEKRAGSGEEPLIVWFRTFYEKKDGGFDEGYRACSVLWAKDDHEYFGREPDETMAQFMERVRAAGAARGHTITDDIQEREQ